MDRRELILSRVFATLATIPPIPPATSITIIRNRGELGEDKRPTIVLLDGSQDALPLVQGQGRPGLSPNLMRLRPQIFVLVTPRPPKNEGVGEELSAYYTSILKTLDQDQTLLALLGSNGEIVNERANTDMQTGSSMQGQLQLFLALVYPFNPSVL